MLRLMFRRALAFVLLITLAPLVSEVVEWGVHYLSHGDFVHADHHSNPSPDAEHGCTALFHLCGCHATFATGATPTQLAVAFPARPRSWVPDRPSHGRDQDPPPHLPPLA